MPQGFNLGFSEESVMLVDFCHGNEHEAEHDQEDGLLISLTKKEVWLTMLGWLVLSQCFECLTEDCASVTEKMAELVDIQKQHWRERPEGLS